jgi:hypothetical protein
LTKSTELSPPLGASALQSLKIPPLVPILSQINPIHTTPTYLSKSISVLSTHHDSSPSHIIYPCSPPRSCYIRCPSHPPGLTIVIILGVAPRCSRSAQGLQQGSGEWRGVASIPRVKTPVITDALPSCAVCSSGSLVPFLVVSIRGSQQYSHGSANREHRVATN